MRKYETVFISDPDLQDQARSALFDRVRSIITTEKGLILDFDEWGNKKLAYEIRKKSRGHYVCVTYGGTGSLVSELERNFRLTDDVLKFMTIVLTEDVAKEQIEQEIQDAQDAAAEVETKKAADAATKEAAKKEAAAEEAAKETVEEVTEEPKKDSETE